MLLTEPTAEQFRALLKRTTDLTAAEIERAVERLHASRKIRFGELDREIARRTLMRCGRRTKA